MLLSSRTEATPPVEFAVNLPQQLQCLTDTGGFVWRVSSDALGCDAASRRLLGFEPSGPVSLALLISRVFAEDRRAVREQLEQVACQTGDLSARFRLSLPDGTVRYVQMQCRAIADPHGCCLVVGAMRDVTEQCLCEAALRQARAELAYVARVVSLGELSASIAHEIKQPLSGIITNASTCLRMLAAEPPDLIGARETAKRTLRDGNRASDVITRLRALFTRNTVSGESVDLNQTAQEALTLALSDLQRRRITVRTEWMPGAPAVLGDRIQIHQVILNLILNAADAMGGIDDRPRRLTLRTALTDGNRVLLSVEDTGSGIASQESRLFEPFYTTKNDGMGIGLAISRTIIIRHGGDLWATSNDGPGATFSFCLPPAPDASDASRLAGQGDCSSWQRAFKEEPCNASLHW